MTQVVRSISPVAFAILVVLIIKPIAASQTYPDSSQGAQITPAEILRTFRTIYIQTNTWLSKPEMLGGALQNKREFDDWGLAIVADSRADVIITVDHQPGWFYYTYRMVHPQSGIIVITGTVTAWDGKAACGKVANEIVHRIRRVRSASAQKS